MCINQLDKQNKTGLIMCKLLNQLKRLIYLNIVNQIYCHLKMCLHFLKFAYDDKLDVKAYDDKLDVKA